MSLRPPVPGTSATVFFEDTLTGAVADILTKVDKSTTWVNVKDSPYNAVGDGVADDTTAIQAAVTAGVGRSVLIPKGTYLVQGIKLPSNTSLFGTRGSVLKLKDSSPVIPSWAWSHRAILVNTDGTLGNTDIHIDGLEFDGNVTNNHASEFTFGVELAAVLRGSVTDCYFHDLRGDAVLLATSPGTFLPCEDVSVEGITLNNIGFLNGGSGNARQGITCAGGKRITVRNVKAKTIASCVVDFEADDATSVFQNCVIDQVEACDCLVGVALIAVGANTATDNFIGRVTLQDGPVSALTYGVRIDKNLRTTIDGVTADIAYFGSAVLLENSTDTLVKGVNSYGSNQAASNFSAVRVDNSLRTLVTGCQLRNAGGSQRYGVEETGTSDATKVVGNNVLEGSLGQVGFLSGNSMYLGGNGGKQAIASAATLTLGQDTQLVQVTGTTNVTSVTASWPGRLVVLQFAGVLTFTDGSNLKLAGNFVTTADDTITLICDGTNWFEVCRAVN